MKDYYFQVGPAMMSFSFINDTTERREWKDRKKYSHYAILHRLINFMKNRGFEIQHDPEVSKIIRSDYWIGRKGELRFTMHRYPRGFSFEFYQEIVTKNPNGGRYDFDKYEKCPYLIRISWINETNKMAAFLGTLGIENRSPKQYKFAADRIKKDFVKSWHHPQKSMNFDLEDLHGTTCEASYNHTDANGKTIYNGDVKYFRGYRTGRLMRGTVYHNINNMWWVILDKFNYTNMADFELFDPSSDDFKIRRKKKDRKPQSYLDKLDSLSKLTTRELMRELKKRTVKVV